MSPDSSAWDLPEAPRSTIDLALIRWSVTWRSWADLASGHTPSLGPFLAGWFWRDMGLACPPRDALGTFGDSFRVGWRECDDTRRIAARELPHAYKGIDRECLYCGLSPAELPHRLFCPVCGERAEIIGAFPDGAARYAVHYPPKGHPERTERPVRMCRTAKRPET